MHTSRRYDNDNRFFPPPFVAFSSIVIVQATASFRFIPYKKPPDLLEVISSKSFNTRIKGNSDRVNKSNSVALNPQGYSGSGPES
jgi:hypothetical protein